MKKCRLLSFVNVSWCLRTSSQRQNKWVLDFLSWIPQSAVFLKAKTLGSVLAPAYLLILIYHVPLLLPLFPLQNCLCHFSGFLQCFAHLFSVTSAGGLSAFCQFVSLSLCLHLPVDLVFSTWPLQFWPRHVIIMTVSPSPLYSLYRNVCWLVI